MKSLLLACLLPAFAFGTVTCRTADNTAANGSWVYSSVNQIGSCGGSETRPVWYYITTTTYNEAEVQAAFNDAWLGDRIIYTAGSEYPQSKGIAITQRRNGTGTLLVTTTEYDKLPAVGTRITPAYAPLLAKFVSTATKLSIGNSNGGGPHSFIIPGGPAATAHIEFRGLSFEFRMTGSETWEVEAGTSPILVGSSGRSAPSFDSAHNMNTYTRAGITAGVGNDILVASTDGLELLMPRQSITVAGVNPVYKIVAINRSTRTISVCSDGQDDLPCTGIAATVASGRQVYSFLNTSGSNIFQPDDIVIRHCLFLAPPVTVLTGGNIDPKSRTSRGWAAAAFNSKAATFADNYVQIFSVMSNLEPKGLGVLEAYGPHTITNNYFYGGMSVMYGGAFSSTNSHLVGGATWKYNMMYSPSEALMNGFSSAATADNWSPLFGSSALLSADITVAGLPANSPRFVIVGRSIFQPSSEVGVSFWNSLNSGVVAPTLPACFATAGLGTGKIGYCYDGDSSRPGTTYCRDGVGNSLIPHAGDGVCWRLATGNNWDLHSTTKNSWEAKTISNLLFKFNVLWGFPPNDGGMNLTQFNVMNIKLTNMFGSTVEFPGITSGCLFDPALYPPTGLNAWPECYRAYADNVVLANNWFKSVWSGPKLTGNYNSGTNGTGAESGHDWTVTGNLFTMLGPPVYLAHSNISFGRNGSGDTCRAGAGVGGVCPTQCTACPGSVRDPYLPPVNNIEISNNTWYTPWQQTRDYTGGGTPQAFSPWQQGGPTTSGVNPDSTWSVYTGRRVMSGNVWARYGRGTMFVGTTSSYGGIGEGFYIPTLWPGTTHSDTSGAVGYWGKQIFIGAAGARTATSSVDRGGAYPGNTTPGQETVWTGCAPDNFTNTTACSGGGVTGAGGLYPNYPGVPDYGRVFVAPAAGDFRVKLAWGKRAEAGADLGADPGMIPMIKGLNVSPTDRAVLFEYRLTAPIQNIPCVVEVHTAPDFETTNWAGTTTGYAGELTNIATYYRQDADDADRYYRDGNRRMLAVGYSVNLTPATDYYYRLMCGGDMALGSFQTAAAVTSTAANPFVRVMAMDTAATMSVAYGTAYSRATDTISGGGTATSACATGARCAVTPALPRGSIVYYRVSELAADTSVLYAGKVGVIAVK